METHTTTSSQHDIEVGRVKLTERKETTKVTDDNQVNIGKTVIKHIRTIKEPIRMEQEEDDSQDFLDDSQRSLEGSEMPVSSVANQERAMALEKPSSPVSEVASELLEPDSYVIQSVTIYQRMILKSFVIAQIKCGQ